MKNADLIEKLQQYPGDMEVVIWDILRAEKDATGSGNSDAAYSAFDVTKEEGYNYDTDEETEYIALIFENNFIDEEDKEAQEKESAK